MLTASQFNVTPVDEADAEHAYPGQEVKGDNIILDSIAFPSTIDPHGKTLADVEDLERKDETKREKAAGRGIKWVRDIYKCKYCKESFTWATKLQTHLLSHSAGYMEKAEAGESVESMEVVAGDGGMEKVKEKEKNGAEVNTAATAANGLRKWIGEKFRKLERWSELND